VKASVYRTATHHASVSDAFDIPHDGLEYKSGPYFQRRSILAISRECLGGAAVVLFRIRARACRATSHIPRSPSRSGNSVADFNSESEGPATLQSWDGVGFQRELTKDTCGYEVRYGVAIMDWIVAPDYLMR